MINKKFKVSDKKFFKKPKSINLARGETKDAFFGDGTFKKTTKAFEELTEDFD